jgi:GMP synthase (glutamine-hydrolysing)
MSRPATVLIVQHVPHESPGLLADALAAAGLEPVPLWWYDPPQAPRFDPRQHAGLVVLGGPMNVDQTREFPFLQTNLEWLRAAVADELPTLGICLGAQLLAKSLGARVYPNRVKEIGWYSLDLTAQGLADPLLGGGRQRETVFQWHGDTFDLPPGASHLASSPDCPHQAFACGQAWGLQFHLEVTGALIESWLVEPGNCRELAALDPLAAESIRRETPARLAALAPWAAEVLGRFAALARQKADGRRAP